MSALDAAAFCAEQVRNHDFDRYAATLFMPADRRRALLALYAFNVEISRIREQVSQPLPGEIRLQWWTDMLAGAGQNGLKDGGVEGHPVAAELLLAMRAHELPADRLSKLVDAHVFDLYNDPMPDLPLLESHLRDTSSTLFALAARILGHVSDEIDHVAEHSGLAAGLARTIAMLPVDAARRQLFIPLDILQQNGGTAEDIFARKMTSALSATLNHMIAEARAHLQTASAMLPGLARDARSAFLALALALTHYDLHRLEVADPFALYQRSRLRTLWTLWIKSRALSRHQA